MTPHALNVGNTRLLQMVPDARGVKRDAVALGDRQERRVAEQDRIVAIKNSFDAHDALIAAVSVIARPLAKGPFRMRLLFRWRHLAFDDNFRARRDWQAGVRRADNFQ